MESILTSIKKLLGITEDYTHFDTDIIMHINAVFMVLNQLGVGPSEIFSITDKSATWHDFIPDDNRVSLVKSYMYLKVRMMFDPPSGSAMEAASRLIDEYESRLNIAFDDVIDVSSLVTKHLDYNKLTNKPTINGEPLVGNYDEKDPTNKPMSSTSVDDVWNETFEE